MRKSAGFLVGLILLFGITGIGYADPVLIDLAGPGDGSAVAISNVVTLGPTTLTAALVPGLDSTSFTLNDGQTAEVPFFTLTVSGAGLGSANVNATLAFQSPPGVSSSGGGSVGWWTFFGIISGGVLTWDPATLPDTITLANGTVLSISFEDGVAIGCGDSATVHAYITNHGGTAVPEPTTLLLLGVGLVGLGAWRRRS